MPFKVKFKGKTQLSNDKSLCRWCYEISVDGDDSFDENFAYGLDFPPGVKIRELEEGDEVPNDNPDNDAGVSGPWTVSLPNGEFSSYYVAYGYPESGARSLTICFVGRCAQRRRTDISLEKVFDEAVDTSLWREIPYSNSIMPGPLAMTSVDERPSHVMAFLAQYEATKLSYLLAKAELPIVLPPITASSSLMFSEEQPKETFISPRANKRKRTASKSGPTT